MIYESSFSDNFLASVAALGVRTFVKRAVTRQTCPTTETAMFTSNPDCGRQKGYFRYTLGLAVWAALFCLLIWLGEVVEKTAATSAMQGIMLVPSGSVVFRS